MDQDRCWHLDKKVPVALIVAILIQGAAVIWWGSGLTERVNSLERCFQMAAPQADRLTRVEAKIEGIQEGITEIKRMIQRAPPP